MIYEDVYDNIGYTVRTCYGVTPAQLAVFFNNELDWPSVKACITTMLANCRVSYDAMADLITWRGGVPLKTQVLAKRVYAFWVVAAMGSDKVQDFYPLEQPGQFLVVGTEGDVYDITLIENRVDCDLAAHMRNMFTMDPENDTINHIALLKHAKLAEEIDLRKYGFDSYCIYDENHLPVYYQLD